MILTTKITPGIDGRAKQSKSLGNYIGLAHTHREKFGRVMSMPDNLIHQYFEVYTDVSLTEIQSIEKVYVDDPMKYKLMLAREIVKRYHGEIVANKEYVWFKKTFSQRQIPEDIPEVIVMGKSLTGFELLRLCLPKDQCSNSEIRRLIEQGAMTIEGRTVDIDDKVDLTKTNILVKVGKRKWFKVNSHRAKAGERGWTAETN